jgi:hypothetical protein
MAMLALVKQKEDELQQQQQKLKQPQAEEEAEEEEEDLTPYDPKNLNHDHAAYYTDRRTFKIGRERKTTTLFVLDFVQYYAAGAQGGGGSPHKQRRAMVAQIHYILRPDETDILEDDGFCILARPHLLEEDLCGHEPGEIDANELVLSKVNYVCLTAKDIIRVVRVQALSGVPAKPPHLNHSQTRSSSPHQKNIPVDFFVRRFAVEYDEVTKRGTFFKTDFEVYEDRETLLADCHDFRLNTHVLYLYDTTSAYHWGFGLSWGGGSGTARLGTLIHRVSGPKSFKQARAIAILQGEARQGALRAREERQGKKGGSIPVLKFTPSFDVFLFRLPDEVQVKKEEGDEKQYLALFGGGESEKALLKKKLPLFLVEENGPIFIQAHEEDDCSAEQVVGAAGGKKKTAAPQKEQDGKKRAKLMNSS